MDEAKRDPRIEPKTGDVLLDSQAGVNIIVSYRGTHSVEFRFDPENTEEGSYKHSSISDWRERVVRCRVLEKRGILVK